MSMTATDVNISGNTISDGHDCIQSIQNALDLEQLGRRLQPIDTGREYGECLEGTRNSVINFITSWLRDGRGSALWLVGSAGSGKSTIAATIAQLARNERRLGAVVHIEYDKSEQNVAGLIGTLAYRLALSSPILYAKIAKIVEEIPDIATMSLELQFRILLSENALKDVNWSGPPLVLIVDALDECGAAEDRKDLMSALSKGFSTLPGFIRILITSRPEADIERAFQEHATVHPYYLDLEPISNLGDISMYIQQQLSEIAESQGYDPDWPGRDKIDLLVQKSEGLFIWAATACRYIQEYEPNVRLEQLLRSEPPRAKLNNLYQSVLASSGHWGNPLYARNCRDMLGLVICARRPLSRAAVDLLLGCRTDDIIAVSPGLSSVLYLSEKEPIHMFHASFIDYLTECSQGKPWCIDVQDHNRNIALRCKKFLEKELDDSNVPLNCDGGRAEALVYASRYWLEHLSLGKEATSLLDVLSELDLLPGLEVQRDLSEQQHAISQVGPHIRPHLSWNTTFIDEEHPFSGDSSLCLDGQIQQLGEHIVAGGAFSNVYLGEMQHHGKKRQVAIKVLRAFNLDKNPKEVERLIRRAWREFSAWSTLSHPNVIDFIGFSYDFVSSPQIPAPGLVSPWMENGTLSAYLKNNPSVDRLCQILGITQGLCYLHSRSPAVVHGDLRAGNILIGGDGIPRIADFGLARRLGDTLRLTTTAESAGSLRWMAPEQFSGEKVTTASDVWSFGMTVLEILTGNQPYDYIMMDPQVMSLICNRQIPEWPELNIPPQNSQLLSALCSNCWAYKSADRPTMLMIEESVRNLEH